MTNLRMSPPSIGWIAEHSRTMDGYYILCSTINPSCDEVLSTVQVIVGNPVHYIQGHSLVLIWILYNICGRPHKNPASCSFS